MSVLGQSILLVAFENLTENALYLKSIKARSKLVYDKT